MNRYLPYIVCLVLVVLVFKAWFTPGLLSSGDFWFSFPSMYGNRPITPYAWDWGYLSGMGGFVGPLLWVYLNFGISNTLGNLLGLDWSSLERIFYLYPFLLFSLASAYLLFRRFFLSTNYAILSSLIFTLNTYVLMMVGGGQVAGVGMAYSLTPLVILFFLQTMDSGGNKAISYSDLVRNALLISLIFSIQLFYDIRIGYITLFAGGLYLLVTVIWVRSKRHLFLALLFGFIVPLMLTSLLHAFWLLPTLSNYQVAFSDLGASYTSSDAVTFLSFAKFENTLSLLHPYWPENIFGKVSFMDASFLLLPILAYSSLLFLKKQSRETKHIIYFALLGLVGAFLAKGANEPFGEIYIWLFTTIPGFVMLRDPTKWFTLIAVSYAVLIPYSLCAIYSVLSTQRTVKVSQFRIPINVNQKYLNLQNAWILVIFCLLLLLIRPALAGQLTGLFRSTTVPREYIELEYFLKQDQRFSRTLWLPSTQRFGYSSQNHPAISASDFFRVYDTKNFRAVLSKHESISLLQNAGVKYIILPFDSEQEIFITDRKFDMRRYKSLRKELSSVSTIKVAREFGEIIVYEVANPRDHFTIEGKTDPLKYTFINPTSYLVEVKGVKKGDTLLFSESFDPKWILRTNTEIIHGKRYQKYFNSFTIPKDGDYRVTIEYVPQQLVTKGLIIGGISLVVILSSLLFLSLKRRKHGH